MFETLIQKLQEDKYITLETTPQHEPSMHNIIEKIKKFKLQDKVDGFSCTDNPLAKLKYNALFASLKLQMEFKKPVIATMTMRDRNKIALQSDLMGANDLSMFAEADTRVAFCAREVLKKEANIIIDTKDLTKILDYVKA